MHQVNPWYAQDTTSIFKILFSIPFLSSSEPFLLLPLLSLCISFFSSLFTLQAYRHRRSKSIHFISCGRCVCIDCRCYHLLGVCLQSDQRCAWKKEIFDCCIGRNSPICGERILVFMLPLIYPSHTFSRPYQCNPRHLLQSTLTQFYSYLTLRFYGALGIFYVDVFLLLE